MIDSTGDKQTLVIRRLRCNECKHIHHELPDILMPYKRHCMETIERIIADDTKDIYCEISAISRIKAWWAGCLLYFESVIVSLREKYRAVFTNNPAPKEIVRAVVNAHLWPSTRSALLTG
jgi:hypothetical protein